MDIERFLCVFYAFRRFNAALLRFQKEFSTFVMKNYPDTWALGRFFSPWLKIKTDFSGQAISTTVSKLERPIRVTRRVTGPYTGI